MPSKSPEQHKLMEAVAHNPEFAEKVGIPQAVGKEFVKSDGLIDVVPVRAAGIMFLNDSGETLVIRRNENAIHPKTWCVPGGAQESGESLEECARRECFEETGIRYEGELSILCDNDYFCTFIAKCEGRYDVTLNSESIGYDWCDVINPPTPLLPGQEIAFKVVMANTETKVSELIQDGILPSPQFFANVMLLAIRISGTGLAYRSSVGEHVWRDPSLYLNDEFLKRCQGLQVIMDHPDGMILDSEEFKKRSIGSITLPYIKDDEVWGIAKIYDEEAAKEILEGEISTSPAVKFDCTAENITLQTDEGDPILVEGVPFLLDHIAIVTKSHGSKGVWDKGGPSAGVLLTNESLTMSEDVKADAAGEKLDVMLNMLKDLSTRIDSMENNMPAEPLVTAADKDARKDEDMKEEKKADKVRKDEADLLFEDADEDKDEKEEVRRLERREVRKDAEKEAADRDDSDAKYADSQARCDSVMSAFGKSASRPLNGESLMSYRTRLLRGLQGYSDSFKDVNLSAIKDEQLMVIAEKQIYADALAAANSAHGIPAGQLLELTERDASGRLIKKFKGAMSAWLNEFKVPGQRVVSFNTQNKR
jgi:colicin import membrane protein